MVVSISEIICNLRKDQEEEKYTAEPLLVSKSKTHLVCRLFLFEDIYFCHILKELIVIHHMHPWKGAACLIPDRHPSLCHRLYTSPPQTGLQ